MPAKTLTFPGGDYCENRFCQNVIKLSGIALDGKIAFDNFNLIFCSAASDIVRARATLSGFFFADDLTP